MAGPSPEAFARAGSGSVGDVRLQQSNQTVGIEVRPLEEVDLPGTAACHRACFPDTLGSRLGLAFVEASYCAFLESPGGIAWVAVEAESASVVGVVAGGEPSIRGRFVRRARRRFWPRILLSLLIRPWLLGPHIARSPSPGKDARKPAPNEDVPVARLQVICVLPEVRGTGVAARLFEAFRLACKQKEFRAIELTVKSDNTRALAFYAKLGWRVQSQDSRNTLMWLDLTGRESSG